MIRVLQIEEPVDMLEGMAAGVDRLGNWDDRNLITFSALNMRHYRRPVAAEVSWFGK